MTRAPASAAILAECTPLERPRAAEAAARVRIDAITDPRTAAFPRTWDLLAAEFLDRGELEDAAELAALLDAGLIDYGHDRSGTYHLFAAWDGDALVGARDCYVDIDHRLGVALVSLAHCLVAPPWRRRGLAALLRALPVALARQQILARAGRPLPTLVVAEMEPPSAADPPAIVRLIAYGRAGFAALDPRRLPYAQPDFRPDPGRHLALPLLGVVRTLEIPAALGPRPAVPVEVAALFPILFHATHRRYTPRERVDACEQNALTALHRSADPVPLLPLPEGEATLDRLAPLTRAAVLPAYPPALRGPPGDDAPYRRDAFLAALRGPR